MYMYMVKMFSHVYSVVSRDHTLYNTVLLEAWLYAFKIFCFKLNFDPKNNFYHKILISDGNNRLLYLCITMCYQHKHTYTHTHTYIHIYTYTCTHMHIHTYIHVQLQYTHIVIYMYIHKHTYMYTHTHTLLLQQFSCYK